MEDVSACYSTELTCPPLMLTFDDVDDSQPADESDERVEANAADSDEMGEADAADSGERVEADVDESSERVETNAADSDERVEADVHESSERVEAHGDSYVRVGAQGSTCAQGSATATASMPTSTITPTITRTPLIIPSPLQAGSNASQPTKKMTKKKIWRPTGLTGNFLPPRLVTRSSAPESIQQRTTSNPLPQNHIPTRKWIP